MNKPLPELDYWAVPRCWPGETVAILAGGKSLKLTHVDRVAKASCRVVAINRAYQIAPWADWLYGCDADRFWTWHPDAVGFAGIKIVVRGCGDASSASVKWRKIRDLALAGVRVLRHSGLDFPCAPKHEGISPDARLVRGNNGLHQVMSVLPHTGATTLVLLGADMRGGHWHGGYPTSEPDYSTQIIPLFARLARDLAEARITVLNCSPGSALPYWPILNPEDVL